MEPTTDWQRAERRYTDPVIGDGTLSRLFAESAERHADRIAQGYKGGVYDRSLAGSVVERAPPDEYRTLPYRRLHEIVRHLAAGFRDLGVEADDRVAIYADTRMEWAQCDLALLASGAVVTTVYTDSSTEQVEYLLGDPEASAVVCGNAALADRVLDAVEAGDLAIEFVVVMDDFEEGRFARAESEAAVPVHTLEMVYDRGASAFDRGSYERWLDDRDPDDLASLIYTSGTTGQPKGVRLTHRNFRANINGIRRRFGPRPDKTKGMAVLDETARSLSFLPLAHVFERTSGHFVMFASGATVAYAESADTIAEDIALVRPTTATSVPRVYERIFDSMVEEAGDGLGGTVFDWALDVGRAYQRADDPDRSLRIRHAVADRLVFEQVRENLGGRIDFFISGGGTLSPDLAELFAGMGLPIFEGYGLTETAPVVSVNPPEAPRPGTIGPPLDNVDVALDDTRLDDAALDATISDETAVSEVSDDDSGVLVGNGSGTNTVKNSVDPDDIGELLVRGPNVSLGYWNRPDETGRAFTKEALASEVVREAQNASRDDETVSPSRTTSESSEERGSSKRWFRTGDLIERRSDGYLVYRDRLKQLLVLSTGKNVAPEPIEGRFATSRRVDQCMVIGDERKFVAALIVPNFAALRAWAAEEGIDLPTDREAICRDERAREWVRTEVTRVNAALASHERIKRFELVPTEWTPENDLLTPSMKKKRRNLTAAFTDRIESIYERESTQAE